MWQRQIGETIKLQEEFRRHLAGDSAADGIRRKLDNLRALRDAGSRSTGLIAHMPGSAGRCADWS
jgi:hypothetical protein